MSVREEFGGREIARSAETASAAVAEQAKAAVQARYIMAMQRPRSWDATRQRLIAECKRPGFAAVAIYRKPIGNGIEGPSIRLAETALRCMTNMYPETAVIFDDGEKRIVRVSVTDLEANLTYAKEVVIEKTVERSKLKQGQKPLGSRLNSYGQTTYLVEATEDDLLNKQNALESKALRVLALRHVPGDILDECMMVARRTRLEENAKDPSAAKKKLIDWYGARGIAVAELEKYLGHKTDDMTPDEGRELEAVAAAIHDGEATWTESLRAKLEDRGEAMGTDAKSSGSAFKDKAAKAAAASKERQQDATATTAPTKPEAA